MKSNSLWHVLRIVVVLVLAVGTCALAQDPPRPVHLSGLINDFTPANVSGPWEVRGVWSLKLDRDSDKADFSAVLTMERSDQGVTLFSNDFNDPKSRHAHTHHITLVDGEVTPIQGGFRVTGPATITGNGNPPLPTDFGPNTTLQIDVTGGSSVQFSNIAVTFIGDAASHFGPNPFHGVVRRPKHSDPDDTHR